MFKSITLRNIPEDLAAKIARKQKEINEKCNCFYSRERTIIKLLNEHLGQSEERDREAQRSEP